jgi:anti-sigma28 factor (negative regulator of flagellin synthesis)
MTIGSTTGMEGKPKQPRRLRPLKPAALDASAAAAASAHRRRLDELKKQVADGTYEVDPAVIAREIVRRGLDSE